MWKSRNVAALATCILMSGVFAASAHAAPQQVVEGSWRANFADVERGEEGRLKVGRWDDDNRWNTTIDLDNETARRILDQAESADGGARFELAREAGTLVFEGRFRGSRGTGEFTFTEDSGFRPRMQELGYGRLDDDEAFASALHSVGPQLAQEARRMGFGDLDFDELMQLAIFDVDQDFVDEMAAVGYTGLDMEQLVQFRIFHVNADFVRESRELGLDDLDFDDMISMRIHGVTREYVREMADLGYPLTDIDDALSFRIHGVDADFIRELTEAGFEELDADEVLQIKILGFDRILKKRRGGG